MKKGDTRKKDVTMLGAWMPDHLVFLLDVAVAKEDTDRSKFVRSAIREKLTRLGITEEAGSIAGESR